MRIPLMEKDQSSFVPGHNRILASKPSSDEDFYFVFVADLKPGMTIDSSSMFLSGASGRTFRARTFFVQSVRITGGVVTVRCDGYSIPLPIKGIGAIRVLRASTSVPETLAQIKVVR